MSSAERRAAAEGRQLRAGLQRPCFNTGKVRIGCAYVPPAQRVDGDALRVQAVMLNRQAGQPVPPLPAPLRPLRRVAVAMWRWL